MSKHYAMAYWIERNGYDNPNRCDYSNDREELERMASQRRQCDGQVFGRIELYERTGERADDWRLVRVIKPQPTPRPPDPHHAQAGTQRRGVAGLAQEGSRRSWLSALHRR